MVPSRVVSAMLNRSRRLRPGLRERRRNMDRQQSVPMKPEIDGLESWSVRRKRAAPVRSTADSVTCTTTSEWPGRTRGRTDGGAGCVGFRRVRSRGVDGRREAEEQGGEGGDRGCEPYDATVESRLEDNAASRFAKETDEERDTPTRESESGERSQRHQHDALGEQLPHQPSAPRADRQPHCHLAAASAGPRGRRLATFAHPMSSTSATIAMRITSGSENLRRARRTPEGRHECDAAVSRSSPVGPRRP